MGKIDELGDAIISASEDYSNLTDSEQEQVMDYVAANDSNYTYTIEDIEDEEIPEGMSLPDWMWNILGYKRVGLQAKKHKLTRRT